MCPRYKSRTWDDPWGGLPAHGPSSKSPLQRLDVLIRKAEKLSDTSRNTLVEELDALRDAAQYLLYDLGDEEKTALGKIQGINFEFFGKVSQRKCYRNLHQLIELLQRVRERMASGQEENPAAGINKRSKPTKGKTTYSNNDDFLYKQIKKEIGDEALQTYTNAELWARMRPKLPKGKHSSFRSRLHRIRSYHRVPAPPYSKKPAQSQALKKNV